MWNIFSEIIFRCRYLEQPQRFFLCGWAPSCIERYFRKEEQTILRLSTIIDSTEVFTELYKLVKVSDSILLFFVPSRNIFDLDWNREKRETEIGNKFQSKTIRVNFLLKSFLQISYETFTLKMWKVIFNVEAFSPWGLLRSSSRDSWIWFMFVGEEVSTLIESFWSYASPPLCCAMSSKADDKQAIIWHRITSWESAPFKQKKCHR